MKHESLIVSLVSDAAPITPLPAPSARAARWLIVAIVAVVVGVMVKGLRQNWAMALSDSGFQLSTVLVLATGISAALTALALAVPGALRQTWLRWLPPGLFVAWGGVLAFDLLLVPGTVPAAGWATSCMWKTWGIAVGPAAVLLMMARAAAPLDWRWTGGMAALAALAFGVLGTEMICPLTGHAHILTWHFAPVVLTALATFAAVAVATRRA